MSTANSRQRSGRPARRPGGQSFPQPGRRATGGSESPSGRAAADRLVLTAAVRGMPWSAVLFVASLANATALALLPAALAAAIDAVAHGTPAAGRAAWLLTCVLAGLAASEPVTRLAATATTASSARWLQRRLLAHVLRLGLTARDLFSPGDLVSRLGGNCSEAGGGMACLASMASTLVTGVWALAGLAVIDPALFGVVLVGIAAGAVVSGRFIGGAAEVISGYLDVYGKIAARLTEALTGIRTIRACGTVTAEVARILDPLPALNRKGIATWAAYRRASWKGALIAPAAELAVLVMIGSRVVAGRMPPGDLAAGMGYAVLAMGLSGQAGVMMRIARVRAAARRIAAVLAVATPGRGDATIPPGPGQLVLQDVTVRVDGRTLLDRVCLRVPGGSSMAIVGRSAAGKSMLAAVAGSLIEPDEGSVLLDGMPLSAAADTSLRSEVCYAFEQPALFGATVDDVIGAGRRLSRTQIESAARIAHADDFVRRLPEGYRTPVEDAPLSGGEAQRLGLARAFAGSARLLILDDATSSLDTVTEAQVRETLTRATAGQTRLVIGHRPGTAARCDLAAWLDGGRLRALAPHRELWRDAAYRAAFGDSGSAPESVRVT